MGSNHNMHHSITHCLLFSNGKEGHRIQMECQKGQGRKGRWEKGKARTLVCSSQRGTAFRSLYLDHRRCVYVIGVPGGGKDMVFHVLNGDHWIDRPWGD